MSKKVQPTNLQLLQNGIIKDNPIFVQLLALCPLLAVTTTALNGLIMGLCTTAVMICASSAISVLRKTISANVRIATFIVIVASFVTVVELLMAAFMPPEINNMLGIFIPLIAVNCIVFARIEVYASKNSPLGSAVDALGMGLGFTLGLLVLGVIREILGAGSIFGFELIPDPSMHMLIMIMAPGAFFTLGTIIMILKYRASKRRAN